VPRLLAVGAAPSLINQAAGRIDMRTIPSADADRA
jgi:hypothetical protein